MTWSNQDANTQLENECGPLLMQTGQIINIHSMDKCKLFRPYYGTGIEWMKLPSVPI